MNSENHPSEVVNEREFRVLDEFVDHLHDSKNPAPVWDEANDLERWAVEIKLQVVRALFKHLNPNETETNRDT